MDEIVRKELWDMANKKLADIKTCLSGKKQELEEYERTNREVFNKQSQLKNEINALENKAGKIQKVIESIEEVKPKKPSATCVV